MPDKCKMFTVAIFNTHCIVLWYFMYYGKTTTEIMADQVLIGEWWQYCTIDKKLAAGGGSPSPSRDRLFYNKYNDFGLKKHCLCTNQLLRQLERVLPHSTGVLIPVERGRTPVLVGSLLQLGGTLVPRSTRQCLPPPPQKHNCRCPHNYNQLIV